jgi:uncharacterized protein (DUF1697 family)
LLGGRRSVGYTSAMASKKATKKAAHATERAAPKSTAKQAPTSTDKPTHAALIRGINVGGHNLLPMTVLHAFFTDAGCSSVQTYIQSGNVVFHASSALAAKLPKLLGAQLAKHLGRSVDVSLMLRDSAALARAIEDNPYPDAVAQPKTLHLGFLEQAPSQEQIARLNQQQSAIDQFTVRGKELYLFTPDGIGRSKLTNSFFAKLGTPCTMRNWNTVLKLHSMLTAGAEK